MSINGTPVGSYSHLGKTFTLVDESGTELIGVVTDNEVKLTASSSDIKIGKIAAIDEGFVEGTDTKTYRTTQGRELVASGDSISILLPQYDKYDYTKFQCMIAPFNTSDADSVAVDKIVIDSCVYNTGSTIKIADVTKNNTNKSIDLNITNSTDSYVVVHYFTYKEE